jgi:histone deacetylase 11
MAAGGWKDKLDPRVIYSPGYDIQLLGFNKLHPFDGRKYSRAWQAARQQAGGRLVARTVRPREPIPRELLLAVHPPDYLHLLRSPRYIAQVVELPVLARLPGFLLDRRLLRPMRLGTMGTLMAAREALRGGLAVNLAGGYHHASSEQGEGFCFYADIPVALAALRHGPEAVLGPEARVLILDVDAHQGNGHEHMARNDRGVFIVDLYNREIFPQDMAARRRIDVDRPLAAGTGDQAYLKTLGRALETALASGPFALAFYVAGADVHEADLLGGLNVTADGVRARDRLALTTLLGAGVPVAALGAGGYGVESYRHLAGLVEMAVGMGEGGVEG